MLDDVERRTFLVQPARKDPPPATVGLLDVKLDERAGQPLILPRRGGFAGAQPHDRIAHADRLTRLQGDVANDAVALVEQPEHGDPLGHRRHADGGVDRARHIDRHRIAVIARLIGRRLPVAAGKRDQRRDRDERPAHAYSGVQA